MTTELNLPDHVADHIRGALLDGTYAPGMRLTERKIASDVGVSHIPVREALAKLAEEGLVERLPRRGARVVSMDLRKLEEVSMLRVLLEQLVVELVQAHWTPEYEAELRSIVEEMLCAARSPSPESPSTGALFTLDLQFQQRLWEIADNTVLLEIVSGLRGRINHFLSIATRALEPGASLQYVESHRRLLDAISSGDRVAATSALTAHIEDSTNRLRATVGGAGPAVGAGRN